MSTMYSTPECPGEITLSSERGISLIYFQSAGVKAKLILHFSQMYIIISYTFCDSYLWYEYGFSLVVHYSLFRIIGL